jgi:hypothetical protein
MVMIPIIVTYSLVVVIATAVIAVAAPKASTSTEVCQSQKTTQTTLQIDNNSFSIIQCSIQI